MSTMIAGEEGFKPKGPDYGGGDPGMTTMSLGEEGSGVKGHNPVVSPIDPNAHTTLALGEEGAGPKPPRRGWFGGWFGHRKKDDQNNGDDDSTQ